MGLYLINVGSAGWSIATSQVVTLTTTWQRFDLTASSQSGLTQLGLQVGGSGYLTSGEVINVWGAQIVLGTAEDNYVGTSNATATGATLAANGMNQSYSYDSFGNMVSAGNYNFVQAYTSANQLSGWRYDDAGDLVSDGLGNNYAYDALGQITSDGGTSYIYDAIGQRVSKIGSVDTDTIYFGGRPLARAASGAWTDLIYGPNGLVAEVPGTQAGAPMYRMVNQLGSSVGLLSSAGAVLSTQDIAPFGQIFAGGTGDIYQFTGKERDTESGLDYFGARYYGSSMGRFMSPDWASKPEAVPYSKLGDPQSLNLYSYVLNNPLSRTDPDGHEVDLGNSDQKLRDQAQTRILSNVNKNERGLFTTSTDKNGTTKLVLNKDAAANFDGKHSAGYGMLNQAINAKAVATVTVGDVQTVGTTTYHVQDSGGGKTVPTGNGNVSILLSEHPDPLISQGILPLRGMNGEVVPNPPGIIAGHELLGHGRLEMLGRPYGEGEAIGVENQLRREQGLPLRNPQDY